MNLTKVSSIARKTIAIVAILTISYTAYFFSKPLILQTWKAVFPDKEQGVYLFGLLEPITWEGIAILNTSTPTFELSTKDGRLPNLPARYMDVYQVKAPLISYAGGQKAGELASKLKFSNEERITNLGGNVYRWLDQPNARELTIDITSNAAELKTKASDIPTKFVASAELRRLSYLDQGTDTLKELGYLTDILYAREQPVAVYGTIRNGRVEETQTADEMMFVRLSWFRTIYQMPIVGPRYGDGLLGITFTKSEEPKLEISEVRAYEWSMETEQEKIGRYPIIGVAEAWKQVSAGKGVYSKLKGSKDSVFEPEEKKNLTRVAIEEISLAYYDGKLLQNQMQPIYVFKGTYTDSSGEVGSAVVYYPAINPKYLKVISGK